MDSSHFKRDLMKKMNNVSLFKVNLMIYVITLLWRVKSQYILKRKLDNFKKQLKILNFQKNKKLVKRKRLKRKIKSLMSKSKISKQNKKRCNMKLIT